MGCSWMQYSCRARSVPAGSARMTGVTGVDGSVTPGLSAWTTGLSQFVTLPVMRAHTDWLDSCSVVPVGRPCRWYMKATPAPVVGMDVARPSPVKGVHCASG